MDNEPLSVKQRVEQLEDEVSRLKYKTMTPEERAAHDDKLKADIKRAQHITRFAATARANGRG